MEKQIKSGEIMKKTTLVILAFFLVIMCTACTQTIENSADEIRLNKWSVTTKFDKTVTLEFSEDIATFKVDSTDKKACVTLSGLCIIDSDKISIYNEADKENYILSYKLKGNKLILRYSGGKITLFRINEKNPSE